MPPEFKSFNDNINQGMIQDIAPRTFSNAYKTKRPETTNYALYFNGHSILVGKDSPTLRFPRFEELTDVREEIYQEAIYLFAIDDECFYLVNHLPEESPSPGFCRDHGLQPLQMVRQPPLLQSLREPARTSR